MKKMLKGLTFASLIALSMLASTSDAFAKDAKYGRETAWTEPAPDFGHEGLIRDGVTWEE